MLLRKPLPAVARPEWRRGSWPGMPGGISLGASSPAPMSKRESKRAVLGLVERIMIDILRRDQERYTL